MSENDDVSWKTKLKDKFGITDIQKHPNKNYIWLIIGIVAALAIIGNLVAVTITTEPVKFERSFDLENFSLNTTVKNLNNPANGLVRETELLSYTTIVTSNYSKNTLLHYKATVSRAGETKTFDSRGHIPIEPYNSTEVKTILSLPEAGINHVKLNFELYEDRSGQTGGIQKSGTGLLEAQNLNFYYRALTQSDYVAEMERIWLYQLLWITAIPFVMLGVKALKDILYKKKPKKQS